MLLRREPESQEPVSNTTLVAITLKPSLARLIQNGFTGEVRKTGIFRFLVYFNPGLQNGFTLQCLDLRKIDKAEAGISRAKEVLHVASFFQDNGKRFPASSSLKRIKTNLLQLNASKQVKFLRQKQIKTQFQTTKAIHGVQSPLLQCAIEL